MLRYRLVEPAGPLRNPFAPRRVEVRLPAAGLHLPARYTVTGHDLLAREVGEVLSGAYGFRGRSLEEVTTPLDLACAMRSQRLRRFEPELVEGQDILDTWADAEPTAAAGTAAR